MIIYQKDSIYRDYVQEGTTFDTDWSGSWQFRDSDDIIVGSEPATIALDGSAMEFRIRLTNTQDLLGDYTLSFEIKNTVTGFNTEIQESVTILDQNIDEPSVDSSYLFDFSNADNSQYIALWGKL